MFAVCIHRDEVPNDLSGRLYQLEVMLKQLNNDLERVRIFCPVWFSPILPSVRVESRIKPQPLVGAGSCDNILVWIGQVKLSYRYCELKHKHQYDVTVWQKVNILSEQSSCLVLSSFLFCLSHQEKKDKVILLAEMANLRENNQRLQEESLTASEQLRKFSKIFNNINKTESDLEAHSLTHEANSKREWSTATGECEIQARGSPSGREMFFWEVMVMSPRSASTGLP